MTSTTSLTPLRYDTPTVTLEVMAREAAITQWSDKPVVQILRYQLQVRDLSNAHPPVEVRGDRASFLPLLVAVQHYVQTQLTGTVVTAASDRPAAGPYLEPLGFTQHILHWGHLRPASGDRSLILGTVQLADLADVLEQLDQAVRPLPGALVPAAQRPAWRQWGAAAAGIVAAVGVTTVLWPNYQSPRLETAQDTSTADSVPSTTQQNELAERSPQTAPTAPADGGTATSITESPGEIDMPPEEPSVTERRPADLERSPANTTVAPAPTAASPADRPAPTAATAPPASPEDAPANPAPAAETATNGPPASPTPRSAARAPAASDPASPSPAPSGSAPLVGTVDRPEAAAGATADAPPETFSSEESQNLTTTPAPGSLADLVEQVRERWSPPVELDQPLSYTLVFAADGTLVEVISDGDLAAEYRDLTGIPPTGTVWLSADAPQRVQLRLLPDGRVEVHQGLTDQ